MDKTTSSPCLDYYEVIMNDRGAANSHVEVFMARTRIRV